MFASSAVPLVAGSLLSAEYILRNSPELSGSLKPVPDAEQQMPGAGTAPDRRGRLLNAGSPWTRQRQTAMRHAPRRLVPSDATAQGRAPSLTLNPSAELAAGLARRSKRIGFDAVNELAVRGAAV